ncbi:methyltransferase domain-containing protein [Marinactinospora rubrisoli]|uniref:Protein-L-isoaspartate O-methyltransferase n=1 Tax=Marinactinospora rubrisoli TaxID=2715399 RepID=A0ABW2KGA5_9ACTN
MTVEGPIRAAFAAVPRHLFIPSRVWPKTFGPPLDRESAPEAWADLVYQDASIVTQVDDSTGDGPGRPTSSSSKPSVMAAMLEAADVRKGDRILEVGAATGYNAAVLCELVGPSGAVTTIEVDPGLADAARANLAAAGYAARVVTGDGTEGCLDAAPFDAVIATCCVVRVPPDWVTQTRPGGVIVTPWAPGADLPGGLMARLVVSEERDRAEGRFTGGSAFMKLRGHRWSGGPPHDLNGTAEDVRTLDGDPQTMVMAEAGPQLALMVPAIRIGVRLVDGAQCVWVSAADGPSWARLYADGRVEQAGPRRLWDELADAYGDWQRYGRPGITEYGLTVGVDGTHRAWLRGPAGPAWRLPE